MKDTFELDNRITGKILKIRYKKPTHFINQAATYLSFPTQKAALLALSFFINILNRSYD